MFGSPNPIFIASSCAIVKMVNVTPWFYFCSEGNVAQTLR